MLITDWWDALAAFVSPPQASLFRLDRLERMVCRGEKSGGRCSEPGWLCLLPLLAAWRPFSSLFRPNIPTRLFTPLLPACLSRASGVFLVSHFSCWACIVWVLALGLS